MNTFNKFLVGGKGNGNVVIQNPQPIYTREDAINLCVWLKIVACISDDELNAFEEAATSPNQGSTDAMSTHDVTPAPALPAPTSPTMTPPQKHERPQTNPTGRTIIVPSGTPGIGTCPNGHEHEITFTVNARVRQGTPHVCPTCQKPWTQIRPR